MSKRNRNNRKAIYFVVVIICLLLGLTYSIWSLNIRQVNSSDDKYINFSIEKGASLTQIAEDLKGQNLIRNKYAFLLSAKLLRIDNSIQAGDFRLLRSMNTIQIARELTDSYTDIRVTIPEGKRAEEIAEILTDHIPALSRDVISSALISHEGYLFPDTYNFERNSTSKDIIKIMRENFENKYKEIDINTSRSEEEIVIIASMIEREARHTEDRALVSSIIHNRLNIGMKLDIDATVQYALGYNQEQRNWWKKGLTVADLTIDSPYNTYTNPSLPPAPISNPGLASIIAAANPLKNNYLYYFTDKNGVNHYARTLEEQNENIKKFGL